MNNIIYNDKIIMPEDNIEKYEYYTKKIKKLNKKDCVKLALFCAKVINPNTKESNDCITLTEKWLKDEKSVTTQELIDAVSSTLPIHPADVIYYARNAASAAVYATPENITNYTTNAIWVATIKNHITNDINLYLKTLLRTIKQYNIKIHNNQHYESILKEIINEDINKLTDTDYNMLVDLSQEYYNINPNINNKIILIELLRREYE